MVGDRYLTDIVFGNCNGMLTVRTTPFTSSGEPATVRMVRRCSPTALGCITGPAAPARRGWVCSTGSRQPQHAAVPPQARGIEERLVARWTRAGCGPPPHRLASAERLAGFVRHADG